MRRHPGSFFRRCLLAGAVLCLCHWASPAVAQDSTAPTVADTLARDTVAGTDSGDSKEAGTAGSVPDSTSGSGETWYVTRADQPDINPLVTHPLRTRADSDASALRKQADFWYVSVGPGKPKDPPKPKDSKAREPWHAGPLLIFIVWSLIAGALVAALVVIIQSGSGKSMFKRNRRLKKIIETDGEMDPTDPADPAKALQEAIEREDYVSAVRYLFLITLKSMFDRQLILPARDKTNRVYLRELQGSPLHADFARLVRLYDYTFYGGFSPDPSSFRAIRDQYEQYQNRLESL